MGHLPTYFISVLYIYMIAFLFPFAKSVVLYSVCEPYLLSFHIYFTFFSDWFCFYRKIYADDEHSEAHRIWCHPLCVSALWLLPVCRLHLLWPQWHGMHFKAFLFSSMFSVNIYIMQYLLYTIGSLLCCVVYFVWMVHIKKSLPVHSLFFPLVSASLMGTVL